MDTVIGNFGRGNLRRLNCHKYLPVGGLAVLLGFVFSLSFTFASSAVATRGGGYLPFAEISNKETVLSHDDCRKFGGRPVTSGEYDVVMNSGRTDDQFYNVLYFRGSQYVTFKIELSNPVTRFLGIQSHKIGLCQF